MDEQEALERFVSGDDNDARDAWGRLFDINRERIRRYVSSWADADQQYDIVQETFVKLWEYRDRFRNQGVAAWHGFLYRTAYHCCVDLARRTQPQVEIIDEADIPDGELSSFGDVMDGIIAAVDARELERCANVLWLGLDPVLSKSTHHRQLLAAQLYYLDGESWQDVLRLLSPGPVDEPALNREILDSWLSHPGTLRYLAYIVLYYPNNRLAGHLLGGSDDDPHASLDRLIESAFRGSPDTHPPADWTWPETAVILWRYYYGLTMEQILRRQDCPLGREEFISLSDRLSNRLPFCNQMNMLLQRLDRAPYLNAISMLAATGLWQRLAFDYCYRDQLTHRDIHERTEPAARIVGCPITLGMLNVWLSNGRLLARLAQAFHEPHQEQIDG